MPPTIQSSDTSDHLISLLLQTAGLRDWYTHPDPDTWSFDHRLEIDVTAWLDDCIITHVESERAVAFGSKHAFGHEHPALQCDFLFTAQIPPGGIRWEGPRLLATYDLTAQLAEM